MVPTKPDAPDIAAFLATLAEQSWLNDGQRQWPFFSFHITDLVNAVNILRRGRLLCRNDAIVQRALINDHASSEIIEGTDLRWHGYVRLYFRPRVPTFFDNEGFRPPKDLRFPGAHCRMPVAFLFDASALLSTPGVRFSDGSLARKQQPNIGDNADFLRQMPFDLIYHDRPFTPEERDEIVFRRHAEIIVPEALDLEPYLRWSFLRSDAEMETLLSALHAQGIQLSAKQRSRVRVARPGNLFFRRWTFVERVSVTRREIRIAFNPDSETSYPFRFDVQFVDLDTRRVIASWERDAFEARSTTVVAVPSQLVGKVMLFRVLLDGHLAYQNRIDLRSDAFIF